MYALLLVFLLATQAGRDGVPAHCSGEDLAAEQALANALAEGDDIADTMRPGLSPTLRSWPSDKCPLAALMRGALAGWASARRLAPHGGAVELLGPTRKIVDEELAALATGELALDVEFAQTSIRAAIAAAQDERSELELLLTHARDLTERLISRGRRPVWPRPFNLLAGELWFEVDRYEEAVAAFERAARSDGSPLALVGLARAYARLGNADAACATYRKVQHAAPPLMDEARAYLGDCR